MRRISPKALIHAVFYAIGIIALSGCIMEPVNLSVFVEDNDVIEVIDKGAGTVNIYIDESAPNLIAGNGKISGLDPNKYYMVEEWDKNGSFKGIQFVSSNGTRSQYLTGIGRVSGREITGLTNSNRYRVKSAQILTGTLPYSYIIEGVSGSAVIDSESVMYIPPLYEDWVRFNPSSVLNPAGDYNGVSVPVSPAGSVTSIPSTGNIVTPALAGTTVDYVFYDIGIEVLYSLRVIFDGPPVPPEPRYDLTITVDPYVHPADQTFTFNPMTANYTHAEALNGDPASLTVTVNTASFNDIDGWYYRGTKVSTTNSLAMSSTTIDFTVSGTYEFIFIGLIGTGTNAVPYNGTFKVVVSPP